MPLESSEIARKKKRKREKRTREHSKQFPCSSMIFLCVSFFLSPSQFLEFFNVCMCLILICGRYFATCYFSTILFGLLKLYTSISCTLCVRAFCYFLVYSLGSFSAFLPHIHAHTMYTPANQIIFSAFACIFVAHIFLRRLIFQLKLKTIRRIILLLPRVRYCL